TCTSLISLPSLSLFRPTSRPKSSTTSPTVVADAAARERSRSRCNRRTPPRARDTLDLSPVPLQVIGRALWQIATRFLAPPYQGPPPDRRGPRKGGYPDETRTMVGGTPRCPAVGRGESRGHHEYDPLRLRPAARPGERARHLHGGGHGFVRTRLLLHRHRDGQVPPEPGRLRRQALHQDQRRAEREWPGLRVQALRDHAHGHHGRLHLQRRWHVV